MLSAPTLDLSIVSRQFPNAKVICIFFYIKLRMEPFQYLHVKCYAILINGKCVSHWPPKFITHPKYILKSLNGPFRLTISLRMKGCTEVQSSTQSLMQHLINQLMQLLYYRSPFWADVCKTARWLLLTASAITFALLWWQRIEHSKSNAQISNAWHALLHFKSSAECILI